MHTPMEKTPDTAELLSQPTRRLILRALPFFATMMFAMSIPETTITVFAWVLLIPVLSHLLLGH